MELYHHGIKGQRWGIRRYQNLDGTLTPAGRERYGSDVSQISEGKLKRQMIRNGNVPLSNKKYDQWKTRIRNEKNLQKIF